MEQVREQQNKTAVEIMLTIMVSFLLTSTGWLAWEYHLLDQISVQAADFCTMVCGYLLQAFGCGIFAYLCAKRGTDAKKTVYAALVLHMLVMIPAVVSPFSAGTLVFGFLMNVFCGIIAGFYLYELASLADRSVKARVFGFGYALSILSSWLLSAVLPSVYYSSQVLIVCVLLTTAALAVIRMTKEEARDASAKEPRQTQKQDGTEGKRFLYAAGMLVLLFSIVNSSGFAFPAADIFTIVRVEYSRLVYAAGLLIAGVVTDKNRKNGALCALIAMVIPFISLALRGETVSSVIFWLLGYFTFGFYAVYRIILFSDLADLRKVRVLSVLGLCAGRTGDAAGEVICLVFAENLAVRVLLTALLFAVAVLVFFRVYPALYLPETGQARSEKDKFERYAVSHELSARERDMLRLILEGKTNAELADAFTISENTVKFHVRNLLQKTGCKNRKDLIAAYINNA